jgi:hypothetical protein
VASDTSTASERHRNRWWSSLAASALVVLSRPSLVVIALAGFLARGGILALLAPIVVLPTPAGLANVFAPFVVQLYFGHVSVGFLAIAALAIGLVVAWLLIGGAVGAATDGGLIQSAVEDDELRPENAWVAGRDGRSWNAGIVSQALLIRLVAHLPLIIALAWSAGRIYQATYAELTSPFEVVTPLVIRILSDVPDAVTVVLVAWMLGEVAGGLGVRYLVLGGYSTMRALVAGWWHLLRHPVSSLATLVATNVPVVAAASIAYVIASVGWGLVETTVFDTGDPVLAIGAVVALVAAWLAGLIVIGMVICWRSVAWTGEWLRIRDAGAARVGSGSVGTVGTIGGEDDARPGDWSSVDQSGTV